MVNVDCYESDSMRFPRIWIFFQEIENINPPFLTLFWSLPSTIHAYLTVAAAGRSVVWRMQDAIIIIMKYKFSILFLD